MPTMVGSGSNDSGIVGVMAMVAPGQRTDDGSSSNDYGNVETMLRRW